MLHLLWLPLLLSLPLRSLLLSLPFLHPFLEVTAKNILSVVEINVLRVVWTF
jgi:hypothetical protein